MKLHDWLKETGAEPSDAVMGQGAIRIDFPTTHLLYPKLWMLEDYRVYAHHHGVVWLVPREEEEEMDHESPEAEREEDCFRSLLCLAERDGLSSVIGNLSAVVDQARLAYHDDTPEEEQSRKVEHAWEQLYWLLVSASDVSKRIERLTKSERVGS